MERILFERPREKLQAQGPAHLTTPELLQVIVGSGNAKTSAARLARGIAEKLKTGSVTVSSLLAIEGMGIAKSCQIVAALELGRRATATSTERKVQPSQIMHDISKQPHMSLLVYFYDGGGSILSTKSYSLAVHVSQQSTIRSVCLDAVHGNARSATVAIGYNHAALKPGVDELRIVKAVKESLAVLQVRVDTVVSANESAIAEWTDAP